MRSDTRSKHSKGLLMEGDGLHATLYTLEGDVVVEGEQLGDETGTQVEYITFDATDEGQTYILVIERTGLLETGGLLPAIPYALNWQEVP